MACIMYINDNLSLITIKVKKSLKTMKYLDKFT